MLLYILKLSSYHKGNIQIVVLYFGIVIVYFRNCCRIFLQLSLCISKLSLYREGNIQIVVLYFGIVVVFFTIVVLYFGIVVVYFGIPLWCCYIFSKLLSYFYNCRFIFWNCCPIFTIVVLYFGIVVVYFRDSLAVLLYIFEIVVANIQIVVVFFTIVVVYMNIRYS